MHYWELDTPALVVDLDVMERNLRRMAEYCREHRLDLRPHVKTHKSPQLAKLQMSLGAAGITVAKIGEAEVMSRQGLDDLMLAYPVFGEAKARRLRQVLERARVCVGLDSEDSLKWVSQAADGAVVDVLVEIDFGVRRCGLPPGDAPIDLARRIENTSGARFAGIMLYSGHAHPDFEGSVRKMERLSDDLQRQLRLFEKEGIGVEKVSGGSTPSAYYSHRVSGLTEIRPGTYIFNDRNTVEWGSCRIEDCAASLLVTVVSVAVPGQAIVDGGSKTFSSDPLACGSKPGFGLVKGHPKIELARMNEEHGCLRLPEDESLRLGQRLEIIPNHVCTAVNMHDRVWGVRGDQVVDEWTVEARGKIR